MKELGFFPLQRYIILSLARLIVHLSTEESEAFWNVRVKLLGKKPSRRMRNEDPLRAAYVQRVTRKIACVFFLCFLIESHGQTRRKSKRAMTLFVYGCGKVGHEVRSLPCRGWHRDGDPVCIYWIFFLLLTLRVMQTIRFALQTFTFSITNSNRSGVKPEFGSLS